MNYESVTASSTQLSQATENEVNRLKEEVY